MKDLEQYGVLKEDEWEVLPWIPDSCPPFKLWVQPKDIESFMIAEHHLYSLSLLLKIDNRFKEEVFYKVGVAGTSDNWEMLAQELINEYEEDNSDTGLFHFDSDQDVFCVYSQYVDDLMMLAKRMRVICDNEQLMIQYLESGKIGKISGIK